MAVSLSDSAADKIRGLIDSKSAQAIRFGVKTSGCSGLSYTFDYAEEKSEQEQEFESHGVKIYVNADDLTYLDGTKIDYSQDGLSSTFRFLNPNVTEACGCGESFTTKKEF